MQRDFPIRRHPDDKVIRRVEHRLVDTRHLNPRGGMRGHSLGMSWQEEEQELVMVADQPGISTRALRGRHSLPKTTVHKCTASTRIDHSKCSHYSLGTGDIAYISVNGW
jgi:hypothetical protein